MAQTASACPSWCTADHSVDTAGELFHYHDYKVRGRDIVTVAYTTDDTGPLWPPVILPQWKEITPRDLAEVDELTAVFRAALLAALGEDGTSGALAVSTAYHAEVATAASEVRSVIARAGVSLSALADMTGVPYERLVAGLSGSGAMGVDELRAVALAVGDEVAR